MENAFRILASRFQMLQSMMQQEPGVVMCVIMACVILHNLLNFQSVNMSLNIECVLQGNHLTYEGQKPSEAAKVQ